MVDVPRVVIAAPASGHGKTTVATGLMAAFRARGLAVSGHKVGPDYIDPGYHALASGRPARNLDSHLVGAQRIVPLFLRGALTPRPAAVAVVEGVLGLFDGALGRSGFASTAHVSALLGAPVVLVVDATAASRSLAAVVHGFATFDPRVRIGGVVLNRVGSDRQLAEIRQAVRCTGVPVLGALHRDDSIAVPCRHLGLVPAAERGSQAQDVVDRLGALVGRAVDLDAVLALARSAPALTAEPWDPEAEAGEPVPGRPVVAVAGGPAFTFGYTETAELLRAAGADLAGFDPVRQEALPAGTSALYLGGGFPEAHAADLSANAPARRAVAAFAEAGGPVVAECAGMLYLCRELDGSPMAGVLDATARMTSRLALGYRTAEALTGDGFVPIGAQVTAHEFHRTVVEPAHGAAPAWRLGDRREGFAARRVHASYLHTHWAGVPGAARRFLQSATRTGQPA